MIRTFLIAALLAAGTLNGAIKKAPDAKPDAASAPRPSESAKPTEKGDANPLEDLLKQLQREGGRGKAKVQEEQLMELLRDTLEKEGVPKDELKKAGLADLLRLMMEKNPEFFDGFGFSGMPGLDAKTEKKLAEHFEQLLEGHKPGTTAATAATLRLRDGKKPADPLAFATTVRGDGWLLTKASEVTGAADLQCQIKGTWVAAKVIRTWKEHDLALVKADAKDLPFVKWPERSALTVGTFITAVAPEGRDPLAIGIVSVAVRNDTTKGRGFLGVSLVSDDRGLKIERLVAGGPAKASGLLEADRILEFDGKKPESVFMFTKMVSDRKAGDKVRIKLQRGEAIVEKEIALADRAMIIPAGHEGLDKMQSMGTTVNRRSTDFPSVLQTDLPLKAVQCGGPVTDLDGNVVGIVIARSGRVETMVLPSETIRQVLGSVDFSKEGQQAPAPVQASKPETTAPRPTAKSEPAKPAEPAAAK